MIKFLNPWSAEVIPYEFDARRIWKTLGAEVIRLVIPPGKSQEMHDNPSDVIFYIMKGEGELMIEKEKVQLGPDSCLEVKTGNKRAWKNGGREELILLVIRLLV